jgi:hypothetical protein
LRPSNGFLSYHDIIADKRTLKEEIFSLTHSFSPSQQGMCGRSRSSHHGSQEGEREREQKREREIRRLNGALLDGKTINKQGRMIIIRVQ